MTTRGMVILFVVLAAFVMAINSVVVVLQTQKAVLVEFGAVKKDLKPGLHFKLPFINQVIKFDGRVLTLDAPEERFLTLEKKALMVDSFAKFRVNNAKLFFTTTNGDLDRARNLLGQRVNNGLRNEISKRSLHEVVSGDRDKLMTELTKNLDEVARKELGIEVVDVRIKKMDLPDEVRQSVYNRMKTERDIEARQHRAQGQEQAAGIRADAERQREVILAEAYAKAQEIRGEGDAKAAAIYAAAYSKDPAFYRFYRTMSAYRKTFTSRRDLLLVDPNSEFFKYLKDSKN